MSPDITLLSVISVVAVIILLYVLCRLSERLGAVERMAPLYHYYYLAIGLVAFGAFIHLIVARATLSPGLFPDWLHTPGFLLLTYYAPLAVGLTIALVVTWRYWSWLLKESN